MSSRMSNALGKAFRTVAIELNLSVAAKKEAPMRLYEISDLLERIARGDLLPKQALRLSRFDGVIKPGMRFSVALAALERTFPRERGAVDAAVAALSIQNPHLNEQVVGVLDRESMTWAADTPTPLSRSRKLEDRHRQAMHATRFRR